MFAIAAVIAAEIANISRVGGWEGGREVGG
jgi:hypothetical protein